MSKIGYREGFNGTGDELSAIPLAQISNGDSSMVVTNEVFYFYIYDSTNSSAPSEPDVITPNDNSGDGRWLITRSPYDAMPVGVVVPWIGGYFTGSGNSGFTNVLGNTISSANTHLNSQGYYVCDGASLNDAGSPIFNGSGRYLPNLTDDRFIMGDTSAGTVGGTDDASHNHTIANHRHDMAHTHTMGTHNHTIAHTHTMNSHTHSMQNHTHYHDHGGFTCNNTTLSWMMMPLHYHDVVGKNTSDAKWDAGIVGFNGRADYSSRAADTLDAGGNSPHSHTVNVPGITSGGPSSSSTGSPNNNTTSGTSTANTGSKNIGNTGGSSVGDTGYFNLANTGTNSIDNKPKFLSTFYIMKVK